MNTRYHKSISAIVFIAFLLIFIPSCNQVATNTPVQTTAQTTETVPATEITTAPPETTVPPVTETTPPVTETVPPQTETKTPVTETEPPKTETTTAPPETTVPPATTTEPPQTATATTTAEKKRASSVNSDEDPKFVNPLTGLGTEEDFTSVRPVAIMMNNLKIACPQNGISQADIIYEILAEGGITRLMMLAVDYANLPAVGSIRSARDYFIMFASDYDSIFIHAGGSEYAYDTVDTYGVNNLDGVNMYLPNMFYRDTYRQQTMGTEHSLMTDGNKIVAGIKYKKYRTELQDDFDYPLDFVQYGTVKSYEEAATKIHVPLSAYQIADFKYDEKDGLYYRYQFNGQKHIDGTTGEQLAFENVFLLFCETGAITGDAKNRIDVQTTGKGTGYYCTLGTKIPIVWKKDSYESPMQFYYEDGSPLLINRGKTFVEVCPTTVEKSITFN